MADLEITRLCAVCAKAKLEKLAKKRDHAADVLGKPMLAWTYQQEIDRLVAKMQAAKESGNG